MILAIPFVAGSANYDHLRDKILAAGACPRHSLLVISRVQDSDPATVFYNKVKRMFVMSDIVYLTDVEPERSRTRMQNDMFREAAFWADTKEDAEGEITNSPWMYLDPSYAPQVSAWMDEIETEYFKAHKLVMGMPEPHKDMVIDSNGRKTTIEGGLYFDGPVVLDRRFHSRSALIHTLSGREHWRLYLRYEMCKNHEAVTFLGKAGNSIVRKPKPRKIPDQPKDGETAPIDTPEEFSPELPATAKATKPPAT